MPRLFLVLSLVLVPLLAFAKPKSEDLQFLTTFKRGVIAQCKQSVIFELQMVSEPKYLNEEALHRIISILGSSDSYSTTVTGCAPYDDFKLVLVDPDNAHLAEVRICNSCGQIAIVYDQNPKTGGALSHEAREKMGVLLDDWFPGWREITAKNRAEQRRVLTQILENH